MNSEHDNINFDVLDVGTTMLTLYTSMEDIRKINEDVSDAVALVSNVSCWWGICDPCILPLPSALDDDGNKCFCDPDGFPVSFVGLKDLLEYVEQNQGDFGRYGIDLFMSMFHFNLMKLVSPGVWEPACYTLAHKYEDAIDQYLCRRLLMTGAKRYNNGNNEVFLGFPDPCGGRVVCHEVASCVVCRWNMTLPNQHKESKYRRFALIVVHLKELRGESEIAKKLSEIAKKSPEANYQVVVTAISPNYPDALFLTGGCSTDTVTYVKTVSCKEGSKQALRLAEHLAKLCCYEKLVADLSHFPEKTKEWELAISDFFKQQ